MSKLSQTDVDNWWAILLLSRTKGAQNISMDFKNVPTTRSILLLYLQTAHLFLYQSVIVGYCLHIIFQIRQKLDVPSHLDKCIISDRGSWKKWSALSLGLRQFGWGGGISDVHVVLRGGYSKCSCPVHKGEGGVKNSKIVFT